MKKTGKAFLVFFFCVLGFSIARADVKVQAFADRNEMGMGDTLNVVVQVSSSESVEISEPRADLNNFEILNASTATSSASKLVQTDQGMQFQTRKTVEYQYIVTPKREGVLSIPAFEIEIEGKAYRTTPFTVKVSGQGSGAAQRPSQPGDEELDAAEQMFNNLLRRRGGNIPSEKVAPKNPNEAFFVHLELDKKEVYEGEQITANWYIYSRGNLLALDRLKFPDLKGFWKEIIEEVPALNFTQEVINGVAYRRALLASHALFPIKPGNAVIDEYKIKATVQLPSSPFGVFGFGQPYSYNRSSDRVKIIVKPLPLEGKPQDFSGAVGAFDVQASVDQAEVPINQPFSLKLRFEGEGNAKLIELPPLGLPPGFENYDAKSDAKFFKNGRSYKEFEVLIIPREPGEGEIPAISVSLFNPKTGQYYTKKTDPIRIKVTGEKTLAQNSAPVPSTEVSAGRAKPDLPPILTEFSGQGQAVAGPWAIFAFSGLVGMGLLGFKARRELGRREKKATLQQLLKSRMKKVDKAARAGQWREASAQMTNVIYAVLGEISGLGGASKELSGMMEKAPPSLRRDLGAEIEKTLDIFQFMSFAPEEAVGDRKQTPKLQSEIAAAEKLLLKAIEHVDLENETR